MYDKYLIDIICHKNKELNAESKEENTRSLFQNYFQVMSQREHQIMAECKICKSTLESNIKCESLFEHMKVCKIVHSVTAMKMKYNSLFLPDKTSRKLHTVRRRDETMPI